MNTHEAEALVYAVIREQAANPMVAIRPETPLGAEGLGIDSVGCLEITLELERRAGISLRDENLTAEAFATPAGLIRLVESARRN